MSSLGELIFGKIFSQSKWFAIFLPLILSGCVSQVLIAEKSDDILKNEEFDQAIHVKPIESPATSTSEGDRSQNLKEDGNSKVSGVGSAGDLATPAGGEPSRQSEMNHSQQGSDQNKTGVSIRESQIKEFSHESSGSLKKKGKSSSVRKGIENGKFKSGEKPGSKKQSEKLGAHRENKKEDSNTTVEDSKAGSKSITMREPEIEDAEGFVDRRPVRDPFRVGEKVTLELSYFGVVAGDMTLEVKPFVEVNGRKSYYFSGKALSTSIFSVFYAVDDWFESYLDFEKMIPYSYAIHVHESKQLRETRSLFLWEQNKASFWDKKINSEKQVEEKKYEWEIPQFSQNVFTAPFYLRCFQLYPGKKIVFRVAHENDNLVLTSEVLRRERLSTPAGEFDTVVVKPSLQLNGLFKPMGDIYLWFTDDERKLLVKIESKIKIGKIVGVAKSVEPGRTSNL